MALLAPAGSPSSVAGQPPSTPTPPPPPPPVARPPEVTSAPAMTVSPPPPPLAPPPSPPLPPPAPPPSSTPVSSPPPPSAAAVPPTPPPLPPVSPPAKPNSTVTPPTPPSTAAPPPTSSPAPETPTTPASPPTPPTPSLPQAPPSPSKSTSLSETPPPSPEKPIAPPPSAPLPATPSPPEGTRPRPTETPAPPSPADRPQSPAAPSPVPPANRSSDSPPRSVASPEPPPLTPPVTPRPAPPGNSTATLPLPRQPANRSLPVPVGGQASQRTEAASHVPAGLIAGAAMGGVALIVMLGLLLFVCFKCKRKPGPTAGKVGYESFSSGVKGFQYPNENVQPHSRAQIIAVPPKAFAIAPPNLVSSNGDSANLSPELHPPLVASLSFSRGTFTYGELVEATNRFSEANLLGEGGFGYVHKGVLPNGKEIAVKQLKIGSHQGEREFRAELDIISRVHHKHLVTLLGYCITGAGRFLVYEFVPNNTLEFHLHRKGRPVLNWRTRLKIAIGTAKGLAYLQEDCSPTIIHRDIKAANILLDFNFEAKVSDFGLAKFFSDSNANVSHISTRVVGTFGYLAPEYASSGKLTEKSDVYSFGVMLLELITGNPPIMRIESSTNEGQGLVDWARPLLSQASETGITDKIVDPRLGKNYNSDEMLSMIGCAAACVRHSAWLRPRMSQIVRALEGEGSLADLDEGIKPGQSKVYSSSEMRKFAMILGSREDGISRQSDNTSEYGLYPSCSSSETHSR